MFFSIYAVGEWLWFPTFLMIKSPRVKIKHLQLALLYFLHLQTILPNLAWFFSEYVNIIESCIVWFPGFPCGMNLSINCSPWKNPAKFHLKKFWKCFSFFYFSRICTKTPPSGENFVRKNPEPRMSNLRDPMIGY